MQREQVKGHPGIRRRTWRVGARIEIRYDAAYRGPDGRKRTRTFLKLQPAVAWLRSQLAAADHGDWFDPIRGKATLATFYMEWVAEAKRTGRPRERTLLEYEGIWGKYIEPTLGARRLGSITREEIRGILRPAAAVSAWRHNDTLKVVRRVLSAAVDAEHIGRNPAAGIPMMHIDQDEPWVLTPAEIEAIVNAVPGRYQALVLTAAYGSLRWSELIGLTVRDLDLMRDRIRIDHTLVEAGTLIAGEPKTKRSRRWVTLPDFVTYAISEHLRLYPGKRWPRLHGGAWRSDPTASVRTAHMEEGDHRGGARGLPVPGPSAYGGHPGPSGGREPRACRLPPGPLHHQDDRDDLRSADRVHGRGHRGASVIHRSSTTTAAIHRNG